MVPEGSKFQQTLAQTATGGTQWVGVYSVLYVLIYSAGESQEMMDRYSVDFPRYPTKLLKTDCEMELKV